VNYDHARLLRALDFWRSWPSGRRSLQILTMHTTLLLSPAATGKTQLSITRVLAALKATPLSEVWAVLPDHNQTDSFARRLAESGGALSARVVTFAELFAELSMLAGTPRAVASDQIVARLVRRAIDHLAAQNLLPHYARIHALPGFARAAADLIAEWKRAHVSPARLTSVVQARGQWLKELAAIFDQYERTLNTLGWTDPPGQGWQAIAALCANPALASGWTLLVVDGFDSFTPIALETLRLLSGRAQETLVTLTGDAHMTRPAYRRFEGTFKQLRAALNPQLETLAPHVVTIPALAHLQAELFEPAASKLPGAAAVQFLEARTAALEAREALRWLKSRIVRDGVPPDQCALIARDLPSYRPYLREAAAEFGLPLRFLGSDPLSSSALVAAMLDVLRLPLRNWPRRALLDALRTPYFDLSFCKLSARDAALFDELAYAGQIIEGIEPWETLLGELTQREPAAAEDEDEEAVVRLPVGPEAQRLLDGLRSFAAKLKPLADGPLNEHVRWLKHQIFAADGLGIEPQLATTGAAAYAGREALKEFVASLRALVSMEAALGPRAFVSYAQFMVELQTVIDAANYQPDEPQSLRRQRIYAGNMNTTRGVPYSAVVILGLSEGIFPSPLSPDPFMPDPEIEYLRAQGLSLESRLRSDQQTLFYEAVSRASRFLLLTRPYLADDGERWEPSPYWNEAYALFDTLPRKVSAAQPDDPREVSSPGELVCSLMASDSLPQEYQPIVPAWREARYAAKVLRARMSHAAEGAFEGMASGLAARMKQRATTKPWSASRLEAYATCPLYLGCVHWYPMADGNTGDRVDGRGESGCPLGCEPVS